MDNAEENLRGHQELQFRVETERIVNEVDSVADFSIPGGNDSRAGFAP